ncbi:hypothetical protein RHA1_ro00643 [Rhodococcus jostii RHA1]|uniref:Uncharacterized protein n=1 Tax=Rhodococcus jostii (strain RHA1) TaxID=101510 RepID=Q0SJ08_RHOJR|nr:hypothetical protein RHA1_ro00643 [Rhodococcus jostii RHA1]
MPPRIQFGRHGKTHVAWITYPQCDRPADLPFPRATTDRVQIADAISDAREDIGQGKPPRRTGADPVVRWRARRRLVARPGEARPERRTLRPGRFGSPRGSPHSRTIPGRACHGSREAPETRKLDSPNQSSRGPGLRRPHPIQMSTPTTTTATSEAPPQISHARVASCRH